MIAIHRTQTARQAMGQPLIVLGTLAAAVVLVVLTISPATLMNPLKIDTSAFNSELLGPVIIGVSLMFSAFLIGYFLILREWIISTSSVQAEVARTVYITKRQLAEVEKPNATSSEMSSSSETISSGQRVFTQF